MKNTIVHHEGATSLEAAVNKVKLSGSIIKIGLDVHARLYVAVAQYDCLLPKPARRLAPLEFVPWVKQLLRAGHTVHVVYEACGFGFGLYRELKAAGAHCYVIAPRKLDEQSTRVKTDPRDATTLCQRLSRYLEGNTRELAVIRVPSEEEEQARHVSRQRGQLVQHRQKLEAQGRSLLISHALPAPAHWWKEQTWSRLRKHLPEWIALRLGVARPALLSLQEQIDALTSELEASAPSILPRGVGKLTSVVLTREICDWHRFNNRRAISSYTGLCPGERSSRQQARARQRDQARKSAGPRGVGRVRMENGAFPAAVSAGAKTPGHPGQRLARLGRRAQEGHRSGGPASGGGSVAASYRPLHCATARVDYLIKSVRGEQFGTWRVSGT